MKFAPATGGVKTAALHIASNDADENPFDINLMGQALSFTTDTDLDGLNDASEFLMAALGFDWQVSQPALVNTYYAYANGAGLHNQTQYDANRTAGRNDVTSAPNTYSLYTLSQVQALNVDVPLIQRNPATGMFTLTIGIKTTTDLNLPFNDYPFPPGSTTLFNAQGKLEFQLTVPNNTAFFRLHAQ